MAPGSKRAGNSPARACAGKRQSQQKMIARVMAATMRRNTGRQALGLDLGERVSRARLRSGFGRCRRRRGIERLVQRRVFPPRPLPSETIRSSDSWPSWPSSSWTRVRAPDHPFDRRSQIALVHFEPADMVFRNSMQVIDFVEHPVVALAGDGDIRLHEFGAHQPAFQPGQFHRSRDLQLQRSLGFHDRLALFVRCRKFLDRRGQMLIQPGGRRQQPWPCRR